MNALKTCCGYYCASVALVGVYFFVIMAIMEFKGNSYLIQILQHQSCEAPLSWAQVSECCCPTKSLELGVCGASGASCAGATDEGVP